MFIQSTPHPPQLAPLCSGEPAAGIADPENGAPVIRFSIDGTPVSIVVSDPAVDIEGSTGEPMIVVTSADPSTSAGLTVQLTSASLYRCVQSLRREVGPDAVLAGDTNLGRDPVIDGLARAFLARGDLGQGMSAFYANAVCAALAARLIARCQTHRLPTRVQGRSPLPKWRLQRVFDYVNSHLTQCIRLADMAAATGLTRMHFAAQFRLATGIRPHEYVLRQRIARAQEMMRNSNASLVDVALGVGFQTQAHFTTVFRRFTGQTPHRWRRGAA